MSIPDLQGVPAAEAREEIVGYWDRRSSDYDSSPGHSLSGAAEKAAWVSALQLLLPPPPADVLDVGTGTGFLALLLTELGFDVTGVDLSDDMLAKARAKAQGMTTPPTFTIGDASKPSFAPEGFDAIVSRHVLWTLVDPHTAFANWLGLLRGGGRLVAFDSVKDGLPRPQGTPGYREELRAALPLGDVRSPDVVLSALTAVGFADASARPLREVEDAQRGARSEGDPPGHHRYVYVATKPATDRTTR